MLALLFALFVLTPLPLLEAGMLRLRRHSLLNDF